MLPSPDNHGDEKKALESHFPTGYTILVLLITMIAALTWIIPAAQYARVVDAALDREVAAVAGFALTEPDPQGFVDVMRAPIAGLYGPYGYAANAIGLAQFVLVPSGLLGAVNTTGAVDTEFRAAMTGMEGREIWMVAILIAALALGRACYDMAEETPTLHAIFIPVMIAVGNDAATGVAVTPIGAGIGVLGLTNNPFATVIASGAAGVSFAVVIGGLAMGRAFYRRWLAFIRPLMIIGRGGDQCRCHSLSKENHVRS